jgi:AraC-like DNA-binding protein
MVVHATGGVGYWMQAGRNLEVASGATLIFSQAVQGAIRASQLGPMALRHFQVEPERLAGVATLDEKQFLQAAAGKEALNFQLLAAADPVSARFAEICRRGSGSGLLARLQLLELFARAFETALGRPRTGPGMDACAKGRLEALLKQMTESAMVDLSLSALVKEIRCTPRHLSRVFSETVGMSFRQKQTEVRLARALDLLGTTNSKIYEVAIESGYQSVSLFNYMFRKRFGVTPAKWRKLSRSRKASRVAAPAARPRRPGVEEMTCA